MLWYAVDRVSTKDEKHLEYSVRAAVDISEKTQLSQVPGRVIHVSSSFIILFFQIETNLANMSEWKSYVEQAEYA